MRLFIENSIGEITALLKSGEIRLEDIIDECVSLSERYCKYKFWKSFDTEILKSQYQNLYSIKDKWKDKKLLGIPIGVKDVFKVEFFLCRSREYCCIRKLLLPPFHKLEDLLL